MKVTDTMLTEGGASLLKLCDFLDEEGRGIKMTRTGDVAMIEVGAGEYPSVKVRFVPSDLLAICERLTALAEEITDLYPEEVAASAFAYSWLRFKEGG